MHARAHSVVYAEEAADPPPAVGAFVDTARATFSANPFGISLFWNSSIVIRRLNLGLKGGKLGYKSGQGD